MNLGALLELRFADINFEPTEDLARLAAIIYGDLLGAIDQLRRDIGLHGRQVMRILQAFISAALYSWVFNTEFPQLSRIEGPLIDTYRDVLISIGACKYSMPVPKF